jgi:hypothetical protein
MFTEIWLENLKQRDHLRNLAIDETVVSSYNIEMSVKEMVCEGMQWIHMPQDRAQRQAVVKALMNSWFHEMQGMFWLRASQKGLGHAIAQAISYGLQNSVTWVQF